MAVSWSTGSVDAALWRLLYRFFRFCAWKSRNAKRRNFLRANKYGKNQHRGSRFPCISRISCAMFHRNNDQLSEFGTVFVSFHVEIFTSLGFESGTIVNWVSIYELTENITRTLPANMFSISSYLLFTLVVTRRCTHYWHIFTVNESFSELGEIIERRYRSSDFSWQMYLFRSVNCRTYWN